MDKPEMARVRECNNSLAEKSLLYILIAEQHSPFKYLVAGAFGGICTVITGHPLDTVKVRLQTMPGVYKGTLDVAASMIKKEGPLSLYKGLLAPLVAIVPIFSVSFFSFGYAKGYLKGSDEGPPTTTQLVQAGMFSGFCTSFLSAPGERVKCLLQMQASGPKKYNGMVDCAIKLYKEGGMRSLFSGTCATIVRDVPAASIYFLTYERMLKKLSKPDKEVTWEPLIAGGIAGIGCWVIGMPVDTMKSRLQVAPPGTYPKGIRSVFPVIMKESGAAGFFQGIIPVMLRAFPANAACFLGLEVAMNFLNKFAPWL